MTTTKRKSVLLTLLLGIAIAGASAANAALPPDVKIYIDGSPAGSGSLVTWAPDSGGYVTPSVSSPFSTASVAFGDLFQSTLDPVTNSFGTGYKFTYGLGFNVNPSSSAGSTLKVVFDLPFDTSVSTPVQAESNMRGNLNAGPGGTLSLNAPTGGFVHGVSILSGSGNNGALSLGAPANDLALTGLTSGDDVQYGPFSTTQLLAAPGSPWTGLQVVAEFTLAPGQKAIALSGDVTLTPVPEPSTYALLGLGVGMIGFALRRSPRKIVFG